MKHLEVVYFNGHFYDATTESRIVFEEGRTINLLSEDSNFTIEDPSKLPWNENKVYKPEHMLGQIKNKTKNKNRFYLKVADAGQKFVFKVGIKRGDEEKDIYVFSLQLLEDLYAYTSGHDNKNWRLYDCKCVVDNVLVGRLPIFKKVYATSINQSFSKTVSTYFSVNRTDSINAHADVHFWDGERNISLNNLGRNGLDSIAYFIRENNPIRKFENILGGPLVKVTGKKKDDFQLVNGYKLDNGEKADIAILYKGKCLALGQFYTKVEPSDENDSRKYFHGPHPFIGAGTNCKYWFHFDVERIVLNDLNLIYPLDEGFQEIKTGLQKIIDSLQ